VLKVCWDFWLLLYYRFTAMSALKEFLRSVNTCRSYWQECWFPYESYAPACALVFLKDELTHWCMVTGTIVTASYSDSRPHWPWLQDQQASNCHSVVTRRLMPSVTVWLLTMCSGVLMRRLSSWLLQSVTVGFCCRHCDEYLFTSDTNTITRMFFGNSILWLFVSFSSGA